ncbi:hypothetical protein ES703_95848 [subsurface metagenome]
MPAPPSGIKNTAVAPDTPLALAVTVAMMVSLLDAEVKLAVATPPDVCVVMLSEAKVPWSVTNNTSVPSTTGSSFWSLTVAVKVEFDVPLAVMLMGSACTVTVDGAVAVVSESSA